MEFSNTYANIDLDALEENFNAICRRAGVPVMAVVKADAYGHGAVPLARFLEDKCAFFGVSSVAEALELRRAGIKKPILVLGHSPVSTFPVLVKEGIRPALCGYEEAEAFSRAATALGVTAPFHFAVDTGLSRIGFQVCPESADECVAIVKLPGIEAEGLFSHFATADTADLTRTQAQARQFAAFDQLLRDRGIKIPLRHLDNSAGIMNFGAHYEMARAGIVQHGLYPSGEVDKGLLSLKPVLSWYSRVTQVKTLGPGREISYGGTYITKAPTRVATVSAGYADGYKRSLSGRFYVLLHGCRAPILGRVCMDQFMVDVTDISDVCPGDTVTLIGRDGDEEISVEEIAAAAGETFNYEFVCGISRRVPRQYLRHGNETETVNYLL